MFALTEVSADPGYTSPFHRHQRDDEAIYVLDGTVQLYVGDEQYAAGPGSFTFMPRGVPHGYTVTSSDVARLHILMSPPGFERFFSTNAASREERPDAAGLDQADAELILAERFGITLVEPPPGYPAILEWPAAQTAGA
jgi:quercetin dioxygenase-like cupin family protein